MIKFIRKKYKDMKYTIEFLLYFVITQICFHFCDLKGIEAVISEGFLILFCFGLVALSYMDNRNKDKK